MDVSLLSFLKVWYSKFKLLLNMFSKIQIERTVYGSEEHKLICDSIDKFIQKEAIPFYAEWENAKAVPHSFWEKVGEQGFLCMDVPVEYGGAGMDFTFSSMVQERFRIAGVDFGIGVHSDIVAPYIVKYGSEFQKQRFLPKMVSGEWVGCIGMTEPDAGSDLKALKTTATDMGDYYLVNGSKTFITNGYVSDFVICACRTNKGTAEEGITLLLIESSFEGYSKGKPFEKIGSRAQDTCELFFEEVRVPKSHLLGEVGKGFHYMMEELARERLGIGVEAVASATNALNATIQYVSERSAFKKKIAEFQNTQFKLADLAADLQVHQSFVDACIALLAQNKLTPVQASIAKLKATEMYGKMVDECVQLHGGYGYMWEYGIARNYAAARVTRIYGGANEIMKMIIARGLLRG